MTGIFRLAIILFCSAAVSVRADRVVLTDGKVVEGEIVSQTASEVKIKIKSGGSIISTKTIPAAQVKHIEKAVDGGTTESEKPSPESGSPADQTSTPQSLLNEAIAAWTGKDFRTATQSVTRLIRGSSLKELDELSADSLAKLDMDIARLAASSRIASAIDGNKGTNINLTHVTDYEAETLVRMLDQAIEEALDFDPAEHEDDGGYLALLLKQVQDVKWALQAEGHDPADEAPEAEGKNPPGVKPRPSGSGESSHQVLSQLLKRPGSYQADPKEAKLMLRHVRTTASLVHQKSQHDRSLRKDREAKKETAQLRIALGAMAQEAQRAAGGRGPRGSASGDRDQDRDRAERPAKAQQQAEKDSQAKKAKQKKREGAAERFNPAGSSRSKRGGGRGGIR